MKNRKKTGAAGTAAEVLAYPPIPLARGVSMLAMGMKKGLHATWNQNTPAVNRRWFLARTKGLKAYARYCGKCMLKPYATSGQLRLDQYAEAVIHDQIREQGSAAVASLGRGWKDHGDWKELFWKELFDWKRRNYPEFFTRLARWMEKGRDLDSYRPDPRLMLYASLYDRAWPGPLEFCTDSYAADRINEITASADWPSDRSETNQESVRGWRRLLGLPLAKPAAFKTVDHGSLIVLNHKAAALHGIPLGRCFLDAGKDRK